MPDDTAPLLDEWRQGDLALAAIELPVLSLDDGELAWQAIDASHGVVVLSQSCDIIRDVGQRPFVQVAGLIPATDGEIARSIRSETPSRIYLECLADQNLLIDLDVTVTVHKTVVATWQRTIGCQSDRERRRIAAGFARYRHRFAFPDKFNSLISSLRKWIESKRSKVSPHGNFVRARREIRVHCDNWEQPSELTFLIIVNHRPDEAEIALWREAANSLESKAIHVPRQHLWHRFEVVI